FDTSAGQIPTLPDVPKPARVEQIADYVLLYQEMDEAHQARVLELTGARPALEDAYYDRSLPYLQQVRLDSIIVAFSFAQDQPQARELWEQSREIAQDLAEMEDDIIEALTLLWQSGGELEQIK